MLVTCTTVWQHCHRWNTKKPHTGVFPKTLAFLREPLCVPKVGFEATGHYSYNLLGFLLDTKEALLEAFGDGNITVKLWVEWSE